MTTAVTGVVYSVNARKEKRRLLQIKKTACFAVWPMGSSFMSFEGRDIEAVIYSFHNQFYHTMGSHRH